VGEWRLDYLLHLQTFEPKNALTMALFGVEKEGK
jgi:hypothetical protein